MAKRILTRTQSVTELLVVLVVIVVANGLGNVYYKRFDLSDEKRYTLSKTSRNLAGKLKEKAYFKLYLDGEMSSRFKRLRNEIRDMAYEFREASGKKLEIEVQDPFAGKEKQELSKIMETFAQRGIEPCRDIDNENPDETRIKYLLPGADFVYAGKTIPVTFFTFDPASDIETNIKRAIDNIEYEIANALRQCVSDKPKRITLSEGSGEMLDARLNSFAQDLSKYYSLEALNMNVADPESGRPFLEEMKKNPDSAETVLMKGLQQRLNLADLLMVVKPIKDFSPAELYLIDQYLMKGGKIMWMVDPVHIEIDSFMKAPTVMAMDYGLENIQSSLFTYGIGLNNDMLTDQTCNRIPIPAGGRQELVNFMYFPLFTSKGLDHIITKNMGAVWCQFPATLKPKIRPDMNIVPLLSSSAYTKVINAPATVELMTSFMQVRDPEYLKTMKGGSQLTGALLEGKFHSPFVYQKKYSGAFRADGNSKMIVIADGDIARNYVSSRGGSFPTGYDRYSQTTFANKKFLLNCVDYLIDDNGLIEIRGKELTLRLLDQTRLRTEKNYWQMLNLLVPIGIVVLFGSINFAIRRRKYAKAG
ncbi:MAG: gliding motility-associated ABC transporter substrate-binding protein GldG [Bacteroidetes bacterium]|nr:gliding motility-associated ABC transporter substrate-binding protein GldG [Bacteroidota bacterium]